MTFIPGSSYESAGDFDRVSNVKPDYFHFRNTPIADVTNGTDGTYNYYVSMDTFKGSGFQLILDGGSGTVTVKVFGSLETGVAPASATYEDVTNDVFGSATFTASALLLDEAGKLSVCKWVKIEVVAATSAADDADWTIFGKNRY